MPPRNPESPHWFFEVGLEPVDTGPLIAARYIEAMLLTAVVCVIYSGKLFEFHMARVS